MARPAKPAARRGTVGPSRSDERPARILEAACRAIVRLGLAETRIRDIAREARVSTGTVHYYFETKDDVLVAALRWANEQSSRRLRELVASDLPPTAKLALLLAHSVPSLGVSREESVLWIELWARALHRPELLPVVEEFSRRWRRSFLDALREGIETGEFRVSVSAEEISERLVGLTDGLAFQATLGYRDLPPDRLRALLFDFASEQLGVRRQALEQAAAGPVPS